jgi:hypothetical protein
MTDLSTASDVVSWEQLLSTALLGTERRPLPPAVSTGSTSTATNSTGSTSTGSNSTGSNSTATNSTATNSTATNSTATNPTATNPTATTSTATNSNEAISPIDSGVSNEPANSLEHKQSIINAQLRIRVQGVSAPEELLGLAALVGSIRRAGLRTDVIGSKASVAENVAGPRSDPDSELPEVKPAAAQILDLLLSGTVAVAQLNDALIQRWIRGCRQTSQRVPNRLIVALLERGSKNPSLRPHIAAIIGERGRYVASHNREWKWVRASLSAVTSVANEAISADRLEAADPLSRAALVATWRARDPDLAREAMVAHWGSQNAADRREYVLALNRGLCAADEEFLERCLDDRSKVVREAAQSLLANLPASAFVQRSIDRIVPLISTKRFPRFSVTVELPEDVLNDAALRDGITLSSTKSRAELLVTLVSLIPISWWSQHVDRPLNDIIDAVRKTDTANEVLTGFCQSAGRFTFDPAESDPAESDPPEKHGSESTNDHDQLRTLSADDRIGLRNLWIAEIDRIDAASRKNTYDMVANSRVTLLYRALNSELQELAIFAMQRNLAPATLAQVLTSASQNRFVPSAVADHLVGWCVSHSSDLELLIAHGLEHFFASMSPEAARKVLELLPADSSAHQRLRHLQAAGSLIDAIAKEFP